VTYRQLEAWAKKNLFTVSFPDATCGWGKARYWKIRGCESPIRSLTEYKDLAAAKRALCRAVARILESER